MKNFLQKNNDLLLNGPIAKGILLFAIPIFIGNLFQQLLISLFSNNLGRVQFLSFILSQNFWNPCSVANTHVPFFKF